MRIEESVENRKKFTFTDLLRKVFGGFLSWAGEFLHGIGITPNLITIAGLVGTATAGIIIANGNLALGGFLILISGSVDALDGAVARARGDAEDFGAFVDSISDRYSELFTYAGLLWYFISQEDFQATLISFFALSGSMLVSYVRARAQSLEFETKVGLLTRVERILVVGPAVWFGFPIIGIWIVAVGAHITAIQRIVDVRRQARARANEKENN
jgi:CDP-diacylglycerol---glycerol-3-phosphate 3-phosphatidyltransferase